MQWFYKEALDRQSKCDPKSVSKTSIVDLIKTLKNVLPKSLNCLFTWFLFFAIL